MCLCFLLLVLLQWMFPLLMGAGELFKEFLLANWLGALESDLGIVFLSKRAFMSYLFHGG